MKTVTIDIDAVLEAAGLEREKSQAAGDLILMSDEDAAKKATAALKMAGDNEEEYMIAYKGNIVFSDGTFKSPKVAMKPVYLLSTGQEIGIYCESSQDDSWAEDLEHVLSGYVHKHPRRVAKALDMGDGWFINHEVAIDETGYEEKTGFDANFDSVSDYTWINESSVETITRVQDTKSREDRHYYKIIAGEHAGKFLRETISAYQGSADYYAELLDDLPEEASN